MCRPLLFPSAAGMLDLDNTGASLAPSRQKIDVVVLEGVDVRLDLAFEKPSEAVEDQTVLFSVYTDPHLLKSQSRDCLRYWAAVRLSRLRSAARRTGYCPRAVRYGPAPVSGCPFSRRRRVAGPARGR